MIYLIVFFLSLSLICISEKINTDKKNKYALVLKKMCICLSFVPPVWLGGMRDLTIGTDVRVYGVYEFRFARMFEHFTMQLFASTEAGIDRGYRLLNFLVSRFTDDIGWLLGTICLIIIVFVYLALAEYRKYCSPEISITFGMLVFYLLFYNETYNLLRQSLALAIVLYATRFIWERKWKQFVIAIFAAMAFHVTAMIGFILYPLYVYIVVKRKRKIVYILSICAAGGFFVLPYIINWILRLGILSAKYMRYILSGGIGEISVNQLIIRIPFIIIMFLMVKRGNTEEVKNKYAFLAVMLVLDLFFAELRSTNPTLYRISLYFSWLKVFAYAEIVEKNNIRIKGQKFNCVQIGVALFLVLLWIYQIAIQGNGETYPYIFR